MKYEDIRHGMKVRVTTIYQVKQIWGKTSEKPILLGTDKNPRFAYFNSDELSSAEDEGEKRGEINTPSVLFKDLPDSDHPGKTIGEVNLEKKHNIPEGSLVEIKKTGVRLFVVLCARDCDGTPLYWLSPELRDHKDSREGLCLKWVGGYSEEALKVI